MTQPADIARSKAKPGAPGRPKDLSKGAAILEAAKKLFVEQGFDRVSMDQIAAAAGVSKLTVYSHYGDKESLFSAAIACKCEEQVSGGLFAIDHDKPLREQLLDIGRAFFALTISDEAMSVQRVVTARTTAPKLGRLFWEAGPRRIQLAMEQFLRGEVAAGKLDIDDVHRACSQFFCLLKGEPHMLMLCGYGAPPPADAEAHVQASVDMFLRAYAPR
jgi:TetR/AcrR family transcriptional repressor of mexJK operon